MGFWDFLVGSPEKHERVSTLLPNQQPIQRQLSKAARQKGAGGAFGDSADYYRSLMDLSPEAFNEFAAPTMRQFREQTIPGIAEQFAGMGAGGLSSSGFRNAAIGAGTDLSERLGALRAQLRQAGAQGLTNIGQLSLGNYSQDVMTQPGSQGMLAPALGAVGTAALGPLGGAVGSLAGNWLQNSLGGSNVGKNSSPYGSMGTNAAYGGMAGFGR